jgi:hypothetical protein
MVLLARNRLLSVSSMLSSCHLRTMLSSAPLQSRVVTCANNCSRLVRAYSVRCADRTTVFNRRSLHCFIAADSVLVNSSGRYISRYNQHYQTNNYFVGLQCAHFSLCVVHYKKQSDEKGADELAQGNCWDPFCWSVVLNVGNLQDAGCSV